MDIQQGLTLKDFTGILARRGKLLSAVAGGTLLLVYWVSMALPNQYRADALILVEPQGVADDLVTSGVRESDLSQRLGIMSSEILSRARLSKIITEFDLYPDLASWYTREEIVDFMRDGLSVQPVFSQLEGAQRRSRDAQFNTFQISFQYDSPDLAAAVVNQLASDFISEHIGVRVRVSQKSLEFMRSSIDDLRARSVEVDSEIAQIKGANAGRLPEDLVANHRIQQQTLMDLRSAEQAKVAALSDEAFWKNQVIAAVSLSNPNDRTDPAYRRKIVEMSISEMEARGYTARHPDILAARAEMAGLDEVLNRSQETVDGEEPVGSYAEQNARSEYRRAKLRVSANAGEVAQLEGQLAAVETRLAETPAVAEVLDGLGREYDSIHASFQDFSGKLQQASVQADMERRQLGEQLRVLEAAFPPPTPTSPNRPMILALGLIMGLGLGVASVVLAESGDRSVHGARELQNLVGVPVLADIPRIMLESDRALRSRRLVMEATVVAAVILFCLAGGLATYVYVNGAPGIFSSSETVEEGTGTDEASRGSVGSDPSLS